MTVLQDKLLPTLDYLLHEWLDLDLLLARPRFSDHDRAGIDDLLRATADISAEWFEPANRIVDDHEPRVEDDHVILPRATHDAWRAYVDFGFLPAAHDTEHGGLQLPRTADFATKVILASGSVGVSPGMLTEANASLLLTYGNAGQRRVFAQRELTGEWTGTMCLSESQAGSSLSDITTRAVPDGPGSDDDPLGPRYRVTGNKMWISAGEHDLTDNIVHLVLAKIPGPDGRLRPRHARHLPVHRAEVPRGRRRRRSRERNDVVLVGLNHKLGNRGIPNTALAFGDGTLAPRRRPGRDRLPGRRARRRACVRCST